MVEGALTAADAAEIKAERRKSPMHERVVELIDDRVVHRSAELGMRVQVDGDWCVFLPGGVISPLNASGGTGEDNFRHRDRPRTGLPQPTAASGWGCGLAD